MPTRRAFARPGFLLAVLSSVGAATLLLTAEPVHAPQPVLQRLQPAGVQFGRREPDGRVVSADDHLLATIAIAGRDLRASCLEGCWSSGVTYRDCNLQGVNMRDADYRNAVFERVNLRGTDLRRIDLRGATLLACDLRGAQLAGAHLQGARYDRFTRWPAGFRPEVHGARFQR